MPKQENEEGLRVNLIMRGITVRTAGARVVQHGRHAVAAAAERALTTSALVDAHAVDVTAEQTEAERRALVVGAATEWCVEAVQLVTTFVIGSC